MTKIHRTLRLKSEEDIMNAVAFMAQEREQADLRVHTLFIEVGSIGQAAATALLTLLDTRTGRTLCVDLTTLHLDDAEDILTSDPRLPEAFARLPSITALLIKGVGECTARMLLRMQAPLAIVNIYFRGAEGLDQSDRHLANPIVVLRNWMSTLQSLKAFNTTDDVCEQIVNGQRYPKLRSLWLYFIEIPLTYSYVHAFPNARKLEIASRLLEPMRDRPLEVLKKRREANRWEQVRYGTWDSLDSVKSSILDAYLLALRCHVRKLQLSMGIPVSPWDASMPRTVLEDTNPTELRLKTNCKAILHGSNLLSGLRTRTSPSITALILIVKVKRSDWPIDIEGSLYVLTLSCRISTALTGRNQWAIGRELAPLSIPKLKLRFDCKEVYSLYSPFGSDHVASYVASLAGEHVGKLDIRRLACSITEKVESLRYLRITITGHEYANGSVLRRCEGEDYGSEEEDDEEEDSDDEESGEEGSSDDESSDNGYTGTTWRACRI